MPTVTTSHFLIATTIAATIAATALLALVAKTDASDSPLPSVPVPPENPITEEKRILGKILFWDEQLSSDNSMACGTCHIPAAGGADPRSGLHPGFDGVFDSDDDIVGSPGMVALDSEVRPETSDVFGREAQVTDRAAPSNIAAMYAETLFWDGRASSQFRDPENGELLIESGAALESQAAQPILSSIEMAHQGRSWDDVRSKLRTAQPLALAADLPADLSAALADSPSYPDLFAQAFGDSEINGARIAMALATYQRSLLPDQTPWDRYMAGDGSAMTAQQIEGWEAFQENRCTECHVPPLFTDHKFYHVGLRPAQEDLGRLQVTAKKDDIGSFKTPTLRNVGLRVGLSHTGRFADVLDVISFYNAGSSPSTSQHRQFYTYQSKTPDSDLPYSAIQVTPFYTETQQAVAEFLTQALTDPRVAAERFPFDRPTLRSERSATPLRQSEDHAK